MQPPSDAGFLINETEPIDSHFDIASKTLLIAFGGSQNRIGMPPFEFARMTENLAVKRLFLRDFHQVWFHKGLQGLTSSISETADLLKNIIREQQVERIVCIGVSGGAYNAIVFGSLIQADIVLAFSPPSILRATLWPIYFPRRRMADIMRLRTVEKPDPRFVDMKRYMRHTAHPKTTFHVFHSKTRHYDTLHSVRYDIAPSVYRYTLDNTEHNLLPKLRDEGRLGKLLSEVLERNLTPAEIASITGGTYKETPSLRERLLGLL